MYSFAVVSNCLGGRAHVVGVARLFVSEGHFGLQEQVLVPLVWPPSLQLVRQGNDAIDSQKPQQ